MNIIRILKKAIYNCRKYLFSKQITRKCLSTLSEEELYIIQNGIKKAYKLLQNDISSNLVDSCNGLCSYFHHLWKGCIISSIEYYKIDYYIQLEAPYRTDNGYFWTPCKWEPRKKYLKMLLQEIELMLNNYEHSRS